MVILPALELSGNGPEGQVFFIWSRLWRLEEVQSKGLRGFHPVGQLKGRGRLCFLG